MMNKVLQIGLSAWHFEEKLRPPKKRKISKFKIQNQKTKLTKKRITKSSSQTTDFLLDFLKINLYICTFS